MEITKNKKYVSIGRKIIIEVAFFMLFFVIIFSTYIYLSMRENAIKQYEQQAMLDTDISGKNIDHYISNLITSSRSVYINHPLMDFLRMRISQEDLDERESQIIEYFKAIYYASSVATQIYLVLPDNNISFLYEPRILKFYSGEIGPDIYIPLMDSYKEVYVESTHLKTSYGIPVPQMDLYPSEEKVITVWLPISNLPAESQPMAYIAIDIPISFIRENCSVDNTKEEAVYVVDERNFIIASSDPEAQMRLLEEYYPLYHRRANTDNFSRNNNMLLAENRIYSHWFNWSMIKVIPEVSVYGLTRNQMVAVLALFGGLAGLFWIFISMRIHHYVHSLRKIAEYMERERENKSWNQERNIGDYIDYRKNDEIRSLMDSFQRLMNTLNEHAIQKYEWKLAYMEAELRTMQAQINPHFIYNVIQCFATNALKDRNEEQYRMISSFGQLLHYVMVLEPSMVSVAKEMEYVGRYVALQQMRFSKQLAMEYKIGSGCMEFKIPRMSIQPLVENSITHGNLFKKAGGVIELKLEIRGKYFELLVKDNGISMPIEVRERIKSKLDQIRQKLLYQKNQMTVHEQFIGLENVFSRFLYNFGVCEFDISDNNLGGTTVIFRVPLEGRSFREDVEDEDIDS